MVLSNAEPESAAAHSFSDRCGVKTAFHVSSSLLEGLQNLKPASHQPPKKDLCVCVTFQKAILGPQMSLQSCG